MKVGAARGEGAGVWSEVRCVTHPEPSPRDNDADVGEMHHDRRCLEPGGVVREAAMVTAGRLTREKIEEDIVVLFFEARKRKNNDGVAPLYVVALYLVCSSRHLTNSTRGFDSRMDGWRDFCGLRVLLYSRPRPYRASDRAARSAKCEMRVITTVIIDFINIRKATTTTRQQQQQYS